MGIKDAKTLEEWLLRIAPRAFYYRLPDGFTPALVMQDLTALMVAAFFSDRTKNGHDFVQYLSRPLMDFGQSTMLTAEEVAKNPIDFNQYCTHWERRNKPKECPTLDDIIQLNEDEPQTFRCNVRNTALFVFARDNPRHLPENRSLVHEHRYDGKADKPYTDDELRRECFHVTTNRPLPGYKDFDATEALPDFSTIRRRASHTPAIRDAYQQFGPWGLFKNLCAMGSPDLGLKNPDDQRRVCIDSVLANFPEDYEHKELHDLPPHWAKGPQRLEVLRLISGERVQSFEPPLVGETDLKFIWYIEHVAKPGDHILIRCNDSDMIYILLLHMQRITKRGCIVFLDIRTHNMSKERYERRFICLNVLARDVATYAAMKWVGLSCPLQVIVFLALLSGSDYTDNPYRVGTKTIIEMFEDGGWRVLQSLICIGDLQTHGQNNWLLTEHLQSSLDSSTTDEQSADSILWPTLLLMESSAGHSFLRTLYQQRLGVSYLTKELQLAEGTLLSWGELSRYSIARYEKNKDAAKYVVPTESEAESNLRHILWTLHYWSNAHLDLGLFPSSLAMLEEQGSPAWGWVRAPETLTHGTGRERVFKASHLRGAASLKAAIENELLKYDKTVLDHKIKMDLEDQKRRGVKNPKPMEVNRAVPPLVICHSPVTAHYDSLWNMLVAEWIHLLNTRNEARRTKKKKNEKTALIDSELLNDEVDIMLMDVS